MRKPPLNLFCRVRVATGRPVFHRVISYVVGSIRQCSRSACQRAAVATLTYVYSDSTAVLGPLALYAEPHCYDLCSEHAGRMTVPRGWDVVRLELPSQPYGGDSDDLLALADAVREEPAEAIMTPNDLAPRSTRPSLMPPEDATATPRRGHLRILRTEPDILH